MGGENEILFYLIFIPHVLLALSLHEASHAGAAFQLGDDTAALMGRLSLNPLRHLDPMGALAFLIIHFGWAKPVPVNLLRFKNPRRDNMLVSLAGPLSNLALGLILLIALRLLYLAAPLESEARNTAVSFLFVGAQLNVGLSFFNLIPIPPLDGSHILLGILPESLARRLEPLFRQGWMLLLLLILGSRFLNFSLLGIIIGKPMFAIINAVLSPEMVQDIFRCLMAYKLI